MASKELQCKIFLFGFSILLVIHVHMVCSYSVHFLFIFRFQYLVPHPICPGIVQCTGFKDPLHILQSRFYCRFPQVKKIAKILLNTLIFILTHDNMSRYCQEFFANSFLSLTALTVRYRAEHFPSRMLAQRLSLTGNGQTGSIQWAVSA